MNVLILHDDVAASERPDEADTMVQVAAIEAWCAELGHMTRARGVTLDLDDLDFELRRHRPDVVFNVVESLDSRGSLIHLAPTIIESHQLPMTGSSALAIHASSGKVHAKATLQRSHLPTPCWVTIDGDNAADTLSRTRWIIKSVWEHASLGLDDSSIVDVDCVDALRETITSRAASLGGEAFAEEFIDGREFNISLLEVDGQPVVLPIAEIEFTEFDLDAPRIVGYRAKWDESSFEHRNTNRRFDRPASDRALEIELRRLSEACWRLFGLRGYARVDFRVDSNGRPFILEVNVNPCLAPDAGFMAAAERAGYSPTDVIRRILDAARRRIPVAP